LFHDRGENLVAQGFKGGGAKHRRVDVPSTACAAAIGVLLCAPAAALAHGSAAPTPAGLGRAASARPFALRANASIQLAPRVRGAEAGSRSQAGAAGRRLIEGISNPHGGDAAPRSLELIPRSVEPPARNVETPPAPTPGSDFDPLKRRRIALPAPSANSET
jgi:hypothetical protein